MAKGKKNIKVATVLSKVNTYLASENPHVTAEMRKGAASVLETILHATDNYAGFNYLQWLNGGYDAWKAAGEPADNTPFLGDETRRVYYRSETLQEDANENDRIREMESKDRALLYPKSL